MNEIDYQMIFKRKSFHIFKDVGVISHEELEEIEVKYNSLFNLVDNIRTKIMIVSSKDYKSFRGEEYSIYFYSEIKDNYLLNIGYLGEQLDLYLVSKNIGTLWYGIGKPEQQEIDGLRFVIMMGISKISDGKFRKDMFKSKRKPLEDIWFGKYYSNIGNIVRFAPSACNTQPWKVETSQNELKVYRYKENGKRGIMPSTKVIYYNRIDIGIFIFLLEVCLIHENIVFNREIFIDESCNEEVNTLVAKYVIQDR